MESNKDISLVLDSIVIFYFKSIPPCLQQWLPIITETSKIQCRMVIPQVIDENQSLFFNSIPSCVQQWLQIIIETLKIIYVM